MFDSQLIKHYISRLKHEQQCKIRIAHFTLLLNPTIQNMRYPSFLSNRVTYAPTTSVTYRLSL